MKKLVAVLLGMICALIPASVGAAAVSVPETGAQAYILYCPENGEILASHNEHERMKPASTTKLMTTLVTLEQAARGNAILTFTNDMVAEGSSMYLKVGEQLTLRDLAVGMMMSSGNDAANAAALTISGSAGSFAELMNKRAAEIGMKQTHFVTPSGLDDDDHYSTAYDLALLMAEGLQNADFARLTSLKSAQVVFREPHNKRVTYSNHNRLLSLYEYCIGGKTGYTQAAGRCLVSAAQRDGLTLICVTLHDPSDWNDHAALYEYGFTQLKTVLADDSAFRLAVPVVGADTESVPVVGEKAFSAVTGTATKVERRVLLPNFLYVPIEKGRQVGVVEYRANGKLLGATALLAADDVPEQQSSGGFFDWIKDLFGYG